MKAIFLWIGILFAANPFSVRSLEISHVKNSTLLWKIAEYKNLEKLTIRCLEDLGELPSQIGMLARLRELDINNGNGCSMKAKLPDSIGNLHELRVLNLIGAQAGPNKELPNALKLLKKLETMDLSRNGYQAIPPTVQYLKGLKTLKLDFNDLADLPDWLRQTPIIRLSLRNNCAISNNEAKKAEIQKRFPKINFDFENEFDC